MTRREFITLLGSAAVWPLAARAEQGERLRRIGVLMGWPDSDPEAQSALAAFVEALKQLGWAGGRNVRIDTRWTASTATESMQRFARPTDATKSFRKADAILTGLHPNPSAPPFSPARVTVVARL